MLWGVSIRIQRQVKIVNGPLEIEIGKGMAMADAHRQSTVVKVNVICIFEE